MAIVNRGAAADRLLVNMQKLMGRHPSSMDVIVSRAVLETVVPGENIGNLDHVNQVVDLEPPVTIKALEVIKEQLPRDMQSNMSDIDGIYDEPLLMLFSEKVPEQSIVTTLELDSDGEIKESMFYVMKATAIGRDGRGGSVYQLISYRGEDDETEAEVIAQKEEASGPLPAEPVTTGKKWGTNQ